jgi:hypothetical protein
MIGEKNLNTLLKSMNPILHDGEYVFCLVNTLETIDVNTTIMIFKEQEGITIIIERNMADQLGLAYSFIANWITLSVHSSLEAVGLTAAFSKALSDAGISCNVVAGYYHDHIFVDRKDARKAMEVLTELASKSK